MKRMQILNYVHLGVTMSLKISSIGKVFMTFLTLFSFEIDYYVVVRHLYNILYFHNYNVKYIMGLHKYFVPFGHYYRDGRFNTLFSPNMCDQPLQQISDSVRSSYAMHVRTNIRHT